MWDCTAVTYHAANGRIIAAAEHPPTGRYGTEAFKVGQCKTAALQSMPHSGIGLCGGTSYISETLLPYRLRSGKKYALSRPIKSP